MLRFVYEKISYDTHFNRLEQNLGDCVSKLCELNGLYRTLWTVLRTAPS
jgi:hypothetical protein